LQTDFPNHSSSGSSGPGSLSSITSDIPGEIISAGIAVALPEDENQNGLIMEYSAKGERRKIEKPFGIWPWRMKLRGWEIKDLKSITIEHKITKIGAAWPLWP
jgi:arginine decarboxylase